MSFLPTRDRNYLVEKGISFEEVQADGQRGLIFHTYALPGGHLNPARADLLILLPPGYADVPPDMFYFLPWVRLAANNNFPRCADVPQPFAGQTWQRWSRHSNEWRPGIDGIWTMLKQVENALRLAA